MPSPLGHALAGVAIAWSAEALRRTPIKSPVRYPLAATCAALAMSPDLDFIYPPVHRMMTHSVIAAVLVGVFAALLVRRADGTVWPTAMTCAAAYGSHLLCDWLGGDLKLPAGVQLLWPFSNQWFISDWGVFRSTDLKSVFSLPGLLANAIAIFREVVLLGPLVLAVFLWRRGAVSSTSESASWRVRNLAHEDPRS